MSSMSQSTSNQSDGITLKIIVGILIAIVAILVISRLYGDRPHIMRMPLSASLIAEYQLVSYTNITPADVKARMDAGEKFTLVDVRSSAQYYAGHIAGAVSIPLRELGYRYNELNPQDEIIVYCQIGVGSIAAAQLLVAYGFDNVKNMVGGISEWQYGLVVEGSELLVL